MIKIKNLSKSYDNLRVLNSINLDINKEEISVIIGPPGTGKSTF